MNLLKETQDILSENNKNGSDVCWVQFEQFYCSWEDFNACANFDYDHGYGGNEIVSSLKIVGRDWWLERGEYDGSEWWEFKVLPKKPILQRTPIEDDLKER